jgi:hypothetical protein
MKGRILAIGAAACAVLLSGGAAFAQGTSACAPGQNQDAYIDHYDTVEPTSSPTPSGHVDNLGQALAAGFYGNTSNPRASGHGVIPSISPGPQTTHETFTSIGTFIHQLCPPN